ncbi:MAG: hypothetical protein HYZ00_09470, partial [Candidatus Hydrogenedentes bacterium]|nr:hypothetical protein [Candidatus Hydrogenedentota bacterium]
DVTEIIRVEVDAEDRLKSYRFIKRTCGQGVGTDALLAPEICGQQIENLVALRPEEFLAEHPVQEPLEEFLHLKHLIAVQSALEVMMGRAECGPEALCAAAEVSYEDGDTILEARIKVDLVTEAIKACGSCRSCGKGRHSKTVIFN